MKQLLALLLSLAMLILAGCSATGTSSTPSPEPTPAVQPLSSAEADASGEGAEPEPTEFFMLPQKPKAPTPTPRPTLPPAESYARITVGNYSYLYPLNEDMDIPIRQSETVENVLHISKNSVTMASSSCADHLCIEQGEVTLDNKDDRILFNMIICLPNNVMVELLTREEAEAAWNGVG
ncbi:MAG: NusG domain II-containing protein [Clostridia bacterium]|nr:NusG domain II-containing protein [Clostridia bacterium]